MVLFPCFFDSKKYFCSAVDDLGFNRPWDKAGRSAEDPEGSARQAYETFWSEYLPVLIRRRKRWEKIDPRTQPAFCEFVRTILGTKFSCFYITAVSIKRDNAQLNGEKDIAWALFRGY